MKSLHQGEAGTASERLSLFAIDFVFSGRHYFCRQNKVTLCLIHAQLLCLRLVFLKTRWWQWTNLPNYFLLPSSIGLQSDRHVPVGIARASYSPKEVTRVHFGPPHVHVQMGRFPHFGHSYIFILDQNRYWVFSRT